MAITTATRATTACEGKDYGTELIVDARRSSAFPAVINGTDSTATQGNPIRIEFIFTE